MLRAFKSRYIPGSCDARQRRGCTRTKGRAARVSWRRPGASDLCDRSGPGDSHYSDANIFRFLPHPVANCFPITAIHPYIYAQFQNQSTNLEQFIQYFHQKSLIFF